MFGKRKIISLWIVFCMVSGIFAVSAEQVPVNSTILNSGHITQENVLYQKIQDIGQQASLPLQQGSADFDLVFGFDLASDLYDFDSNADMQWAQTLLSVTEQLSAGSEYTILTNKSEMVTDDPAAAFNAFMTAGYSGDSDIVSLLDKCANEFDNNSTKNKTVLLVTPNLCNSYVVKQKVAELNAKGIIVYIYILNSAVDEIQYVEDCFYPCKSLLDLRLSISDLYLSLSEFYSGTTLYRANDSGLDGGIILYSDFKDKHLFESNSSKGMLLASVLSIYGCVPLQASAGAQGYNMLENPDVDAIKAFLKHDNAKFFSEYTDSNGAAFKTKFRNTWEQIFNQIEEFWVDNPSDISEKIVQNLKRRFPVIVCNQDEEYSLIRQSSDITDTSNYTKVFDTYGYLSAVSNAAQSVLTSSTLPNENFEITVTKSFPSTEAANSAAYVMYKQNASQAESGSSYTIARNANQLMITAVATDVDNDIKELVAGAVVTFQNGVPDSYDATPNYAYRLYRDSSYWQNAWYYEYLTKATTLGVVKGDEKGYFNPNNAVTRCEFVRMALGAAGIDSENAENSGHWTSNHWALPYMNLAFDFEMVYSEVTAPEEVEAYFDAPIKRCEVAQILKKLFMDHYSSVEVATNLYRYDECAITQDTADPKERRWLQTKGNVDDFVYEREAIFQMFMNDVLIGDESGLRLAETITRSEATKVIMKPLFRLDDGFEQVTVKYDGFYILGEPLKSAIGETEDSYDFYVTSAGQHRVTTSGDVSYTVTDANGTTVMPTGGSQSNKLYSFDKGSYHITFTGNAAAPYALCIKKTEKTNYIMVYDSYNDNFPAVYGEGVTSRYHNANGQNYEYSVEFFKNYLELVGDNTHKTAFVFAVRDLYSNGRTIYETETDENGNTVITIAADYFDPNSAYGNGTFADFVVEVNSNKFNQMITYLKQALDEVNQNRTDKIPMPEIYLGTPHHLNEMPSYVEPLTNIAKGIYNNVVNEHGEECITGIYYGKENPISANEVSYSVMRNISTFIHSKNKKMLWVPYSLNPIDWSNISHIVNAGVDNNGEPIIDVLMMQPGLFFSTNTKKIDEYTNDDEVLVKQKRLIYSLIDQKFENESGEVIVNADDEGHIIPGAVANCATDIAVELEFDISLVTGRSWGEYGETTIPITMLPVEIAKNLVRTYALYHDLIHDEQTSIGSYTGGPNEQDYGAVVGNNLNRHTIRNHPSGLTTYSKVHTPEWVSYIEPGEGMAYNSFFENLKADHQSAYNVSYYNNRLIYDIVRGMVYDQWSDELKDYIKMKETMDANPLPSDFEAIYDTRK